MKLFWGLTFISFLFATNIYQGESTKLNHSNLRQTNSNQKHVKTTAVPRNANPHKPKLRAAGRRISETKCLEYMRERNQGVTIPQNYYHIFQIGGRDAKQGEFPHMGALGWKTAKGDWSFKCGSSLISHKFCVTAAHCSKRPLDGTIVKKVPEIVRLGDKNIIKVSEEGVRFIDANIKRIIVHPQYASPNKYNDIALVELKSDLQFTKNVQPVCLWNRFDTSSLGNKVSSTGWGIVDIATKKMASILQATELNIIDSKLCDSLLSRACNKYWCGVREHQMCAGKLEGGVDACQGDSGGPLQVNVTSSDKVTMHYLVGVTSFGKGCARPNLPGVYTRVSSFVDWIEKIVWP